MPGYFCTATWRNNNNKAPGVSLFRFPVDNSDGRVNKVRSLLPCVVLSGLLVNKIGFDVSFQPALKVASLGKICYRPTRYRHCRITKQGHCTFQATNSSALARAVAWNGFALPPERRESMLHDRRGTKA